MKLRILDGKTKFQRLYDKRRDAGLCVICKSQCEKSVCEPCSAAIAGYRRANAKKNYDERRAQSLCVKCCAPCKRKSMCLACRRAKSERAK